LKGEAEVQILGVQISIFILLRKSLQRWKENRRDGAEKAAVDFRKTMVQIGKKRGE